MRFWHIGINCTDLDRSIEFYERIGFKTLQKTEVNTPQTGRAFMIEGGDRLRFAHMRIGDVEEEAMLDLVQWVNPPTGPGTEASLRDAGLCRFSILTDDVDAEFERLTGDGVEFLQPPVTVPAPDGKRGWKILFARDPDGTLFHFVERAVIDSPAPEAD